MSPLSVLVPPYLGEYQPRLFTAADLAAMPTELPSGTVCYELHHGRLITMPPPGDVHAALSANVITALKTQGDLPGHGKARAEVGVVLARNPDHVLGADAAFITKGKLPLRLTPEGYLETIPDLVVEVRSKNDTLASLARKADDYLRAGVVVVWVMDPTHRNIIEYRKDAEPRVLNEGDTLTVEDVIPGFAVPVRDALQD